MNRKDLPLVTGLLFGDQKKLPFCVVKILLILFHQIKSTDGLHMEQRKWVMAAVS